MKVNFCTAEGDLHCQSFTSYIELEEYYAAQIETQPGATSLLAPSGAVDYSMQYWYRQHRCTDRRSYRKLY